MLTQKIAKCSLNQFWINKRKRWHWSNNNATQYWAHRFHARLDWLTTTGFWKVNTPCTAGWHRTQSMFWYQIWSCHRNTLLMCGIVLSCWLRNFSAFHTTPWNSSQAEALQSFWWFPVQDSKHWVRLFLLTSSSEFSKDGVISTIVCIACDYVQELFLYWDSL